MHGIYIYKGCLRPKHWFQFADDTAIVTALEKDSQLLCNIFIKWTSWADLIIRIDKCHTFAIKKTKNKKWPVSVIHHDQKQRNAIYRKRLKFHLPWKRFQLLNELWWDKNRVTWWNCKVRWHYWGTFNQMSPPNWNRSHPALHILEIKMAIFRV